MRARSGDTLMGARQHRIVKFRQVAGDNSALREKVHPRLVLLVSAPCRSVGRQRTRPQPKLWAQRRGHVVQMLAAVTAIFFRSIVGAQPMSPSLAFRIDALHSPSWQIAHAASLAFKSTAPKLGDRILRPENCGVKAKGTIYRGLFADLWKSVTERQMLSQRRGIVLALLDSRFHRERAERQRERAEAPMPSAVLDRKPPDVYSIGPSLNGR